MALKVSFKKIILISLLFWVFFACVDPVSITAFFNSPEVDKIVQSMKEKVKVSLDSDKGLTGGFNVITGLDPKKYYMVVKELDEEEEEVTPDKYPKFVSEYKDFAYGTLIDNSLLNRITRIEDKQINGLKNKHTYTVKSATAFSSAVTYTDDTYTDEQVTVENGSITINNPNGSVTLDLSNEFSGTYDVMAVANPSTPESWTNDKKIISSWTTFSPLEAPNDSKVDYVFFRESPLDFKFLTVEFKKTATVIDVTVTPPTVSVAKGGTQTFTASVVGTGSPAQTVTWSVDSPKAIGTTINASGLLTVASDETQKTLTIRATSSVDTGVSGTATVTVSGATITISIISDAAIGTTGIPSSVSYNDILNGTTSITFKVINAADYEDSSNISTLVWKLEGEQIGIGDTFIINSSTATSILSNLVSGTNRIIVTGRNTKGGVDLSAFVDLNVNN